MMDSINTKKRKQFRHGTQNFGAVCVAMKNLWRDE